ncbi:hypothetical protein SARC_07559 [Sphaeroforma arctica JP610]|uniref:DNA polymerase II subunit 2 n=1 Tax=Sphaeroforma arctica JP610 TaxID=667725 RepID=A0A0L0FU56_9EUKA|nr:hypothetical protein SARC_07559 [Sphaeroforma arctica JP610]KNC80071.1 hypothetical protein SARC_07559 [Sphaeroforma arctica JP610]|eukprot:XP_014153973.1 hypothetical protein SARC_07559 [Sphaeroforma arctica JP610]
MLIEYEEKRYHLQDLSGHVRCDLEYAETTTGMFTEQCIVLAEGVYANNIFHVKVLAHPPPEKASVTRDIFRDIDLFGGERHRKELDKLAVKEKTLENTFFVILSDVWLDNESVRTKLKDLFAGYMHAVPDAFIFIGSFSEKTYGADHPRRVREGLSNLGSMIRQHQSLINVPCIFVPSAADPPGGDLLPRKPLPPAITKDIREKLPNCRFVSNPCRIRWYSQEIVIYREDVTAKMQRHCLVPLDTRETDAVHKHLVRTLMDQAHLSPLPGRLRPLQIGYEHTMRLYPHPDVLIIADKHESYDIHYEDALCFNPGSFYQSGFSFVAYWPAAKTVEPSSLS